MSTNNTANTNTKIYMGSYVAATVYVLYVRHIYRGNYITNALIMGILIISLTLLLAIRAMLHISAL